MEEPRAEVEVADPAPSAPPEVSDPPFLLSLVVWIGVFSGISWGLMALFRDRSRPMPADEAHDADS